MNYFQGNKFFRKIIHKIKIKSARERVKKIEQYLSKKDKILDIGAGSCIVSEMLRKENFNITPIDVKNLSFAEKIEPIIYEGKIPFNKNDFDVSLILTVLHHAPLPEKILEEAKIISKKIIIIEDIYTNIFNKHIAYFFDSLLNLEFFGCSRTNKTDKEWKGVFNKTGLNLIDSKYYESPFGVKRALYYLENNF